MRWADAMCVLRPTYGLLRSRALLPMLAAWLLTIAAAQPASAIYLSESGPVATLTGNFGVGDAQTFREFMARPRTQAIQVLFLNSPGGAINEAIEIARLVRRARLATAVDASVASCDSACTLVFAAGVRRHYVHGDQIADGFSSMLGLGFHGAHRRGDRITLATKSTEATERMRALFAEMGIPRAATLMAKAGFDTLYRPSGKTAVELGIATSVAAP